MDVYEFLEKLAMLYEADSDAENFKMRSKLYSDILNKKETELKNEFDYEKMLNKIACSYSYKSYPNLAEIMSNKIFKKKQCDESNTKSRCYIAEIGNIKYEFQEVPSSWEGAHSISDFENIKEKIK